MRADLSFFMVGDAYVQNGLELGTGISCLDSSQRCDATVKMASTLSILVVYMPTAVQLVRLSHKL